MRTIERTNQFKRDYKRKAKGPDRKAVKSNLLKVISALASDTPLDSKHRDHSLTGNWKDFRDCHIRPDLILIYRKVDENVLQLVRLGSHSELGF